MQQLPSSAPPILQHVTEFISSRELSMQCSRQILLTNYKVRAMEVGSCQLLLHMHCGPSKLVLTL